MTKVAWLMLAAGNNREHAGNDGYDDSPAEHYSWDSRVANSDGPKEGHAIALWDKKYLLGVSTIDHIEHGTAMKSRYRCPHCSSYSIKERKEKKPRYRCDNCSRTFPDAVVEEEEVVTYRTRHAAAWTDLRGALTAVELRALCVHERTQHSIRLLDYSRFEAALAAITGVQPLSLAETRMVQLLTKGGHRTTTARTRVGQGQFRKAVLKQYGETCVFTGPAPESVLDAAHLYSYAQSGKHRLDGGLPIRTDIHRLFDRGELAVDPGTGKIDVRRDLHRFPDLRDLHGKFLHVELSEPLAKWFRAHWDTHRPETA